MSKLFFIDSDVLYSCFDSALIANVHFQSIGEDTSTVKYYRVIRLTVYGRK
jgi:hypothetical protein